MLRAMETVSRPVLVGIILIAAWMLTRVTGFVIRRIVRRLADRAVRLETGPWRVRSMRGEDESSMVREQRRRQRIDAASRILNHLVSVVVWIITLIVVFHVLEVDAAFFLSSAGFLGAAVAIGGQHKVNDYLTGLLVHFEDRYGAGDLIECETVNGSRVRGVVDHIGLFSTRLRDDESAVHLPNHALAHVRNLSQDPSTTKLKVRVSERIDDDRVEASLRGLAGGPGLTEVILLGDIETHQDATGEIEIDISTQRPLDHRERARLVSGVERSLTDASR